MLERRAVVRIAPQNVAQDFLRFHVLVLEAIESREPQSGARIFWIEFQNGVELIDGFGEVFFLQLPGVRVAERANVNPGE